MSMALLFLLQASHHRLLIPCLSLGAYISMTALESIVQQKKLSTS
jgi:hypothetical protein